MVGEKYTVEIVDSDGNMSKLVLPGFALDSTQERLIKSVQALGKMGPKQAAAYEKLLAATNDVAKSGNKSTEKQTEEFEKVLKLTSEKQVNALKSFRENFADRVGRDMRNTFVAGGNILTAAIKSATVGLAVSAGLLYKTFMDTSDAFRSLAQIGLGGAGESGLDASFAVRNLTALGLSASEAAQLLTSFSRSSAILGKTNFSKFVAGVANAGSFAADLGLTLEEAAEYAADEIDIRQRATFGRLQLDGMQEAAIKRSIQQTQRFASIMGVSMKDINNAKKEFVNNNANVQNLIARTAAGQRDSLLRSITDTIGLSRGLGDQAYTLFSSLVNAAALNIPLQDSNLQALVEIGGVAGEFLQLVTEMNTSLEQNGTLSQTFVTRFRNILTGMTSEDLGLLSVQVSNNELAKLVQNALFDMVQNGRRVEQALRGIDTSIQDPLITAGTQVRNTLSEVSGIFTTLGISLASEFAPDVQTFMQSLLDIKDVDEVIVKQKMDTWEEENKHLARRTEEEINNYNKLRRAELNRIYEQQRGTTVLTALRQAITDVSKMFVEVFVGDVGESAENLGTTLRENLIPFIEQLSTSLQNWLASLEVRGADTIQSKLVMMLQDLVKNVIAPAVGNVLKESLTALFSNISLIATVVGLFAVGSALSTAFVSGITSLFAGIRLASLFATAAPIATTAAATAATTAATTAAATTGTAAAVTTGARTALGQRALTAAPLVAYVAAPLMMGKDVYDVATGSNEGTTAGADWGGIIGGILGGGLGLFAAGTATVGTLGLGAVTAPALTAGGVALGNSIGSWVGSWFDSPKGDETQAALSEQMQQEILDQQGMALAMALDPAHIRSVRDSLVEFNTTSTALITDNLTKLSTSITGLVEAFTMLTPALEDFASFTSSSIFSRMFDTAILKKDRTSAIVDSINAFTGVKTDELKQTASAIREITDSLKPLLQPLQPVRTTASPINNTATPATTTTTGQQTVMHSPQDTIFERIESQMILMRNDTKRMEEHLTAIKTNTRD